MKPKFDTNEEYWEWYEKKMDKKAVRDYWGDEEEDG